MRSLSYVLVVLVSIVLIACSDDADPAGNNGGGDEFAIVSIDRDSVYWGEKIVVALANTKTDSFIAFIHTVPVTVDSVWSNGTTGRFARVLIPDNTPTGQVRIYDSADVLAKGDITLTVLQKSIKDFKIKFTAYKPALGYPGETLIISAEDLPPRRRDIEVQVNDVVLPIEFASVNRIVTRFPSSSGMLRVRVFDTLYELGMCTVLQPEGTLLAEGTLKSVQLNAVSLFGSGHYRASQSDPVILYDELPQILTQTVLNEPARWSSDSIIAVSQEFQGAMLVRIEVRLKREPNNRASGVIRINYDHEEEVYDLGIEVIVKEMRWRRTDEGYLLYAYASDISSTLSALSYDLLSAAGTDTRLYERTSMDATVEIWLTP